MMQYRDAGSSASLRPSWKQRSGFFAGCLILGLWVGATLGFIQAAPEKIPNDKVIHPLIKGVAEPQLIQESRVNPVYPKQWQDLHVGAVVILQGVVEKTGAVREIKPLKTDLRIEEGCDKGSADLKKDGTRDHGSGPGGAASKAAPPKAAHDFELAATHAVKQWRYRPAEMNDEPVDVFTTIIVEFTSCPIQPARQLP